MYLNRDAAREIIRLARHSLSWRRAGTWLGYAAGFFTLRGLLNLSRWTDDWLWPAIAQQKIEAPVFIFGNARSGTTLLHRLMSLDDERFASMKLYQSLLCAVSLQRCVKVLHGLDERVPGRPLRRLIDFINRVTFSGWEGIHQMGIDEAEEDEAIFALSLMTPAVVLLLPDLDALPRLTALDDLPDDERGRFMDYYEDGLRRHLYASRGDRTFLNKNALFARRVRSMFERFPDARFVYLVRHPFDAIPSFLNMFHSKWVTHSPEIDADSPEARDLARLAIDYYRYALDCRKFVPEDRFLIVRYDDLVAAPRDTIEKLYRHLEIDMSPTFEARLEQALSSQRDFSSGHSYSVEQFGLSEEWIFDELKDVFEEFDFGPPQQYADSSHKDFGAKAEGTEATEGSAP